MSRAGFNIPYDAKDILVRTELARRKESEKLSCKH